MDINLKFLMHSLIMIGLMMCLDQFLAWIYQSFMFFSISLNLYTESFDISNDISQEIELQGWDASNMDYSQKIYYFQFVGETLDGEEVIKSNYFRAIY